MNDVAADAITQLTALHEESLAKYKMDAAFYGDYYSASSHEVHSIHTRLSAAIERWSPPGSAYRSRMADVLASKNADQQVPKLAGLALALAQDIQAGYLRSVVEVVHANVFSDFLEMAEELSAKGYKDPAAVLAGSVLEEHLRNLAARFDVQITADGKPRKADTLNADLAKADAYNKLVQKQVTAWLGLRNSAAHGHYAEYDLAQVQALIRDIRDFMVRHAA